MKRNGVEQWCLKDLECEASRGGATQTAPDRGFFFAITDFWSSDEVWFLLWWSILYKRLLVIIHAVCSLLWNKLFSIKLKLEVEMRFLVDNIFQYRLHMQEKLFTIFYLKLTTTAKTILRCWTKNLWWQKKPSIRCSLCGSASTGLAFQILEASLLHTIPLHPL